MSKYTRVRQAKIAAARVLIDPLDWAFRAFLGKKKLPPWTWRTIAGRADFEESGRAFVRALQDLCGLTRTSRVLEIGCGCGRLAIPLSTLLTTGEYVGVDADRNLIRWCKGHIDGPTTFFHIDVRNDQYNAHGVFAAADYTFPFESGKFEVAALLSVFTHLVRDEIEQYIREIYRLLARGGYCLSTFFLLPVDSPKIIFRQSDGVSALVDPSLPARGVAYEKEYLFGFARDVGFEVSALKGGSWAGMDSWSFQDVVVFRK